MTIKKTIFANVIFWIFIMGAMSFITNFSVKADAPTFDNNTYLISGADDMKWFADYVNNSNANANACLVEDIDLTDICSQQDSGWIPVGSSAVPYNGTFNGGGHRIIGLYINSDISSCGLFGVLDGNVTNLAVEGNISTTSGSAGGITGINNSGTIENCIFTGSVYGNVYSGGIAGENYSDGSILSCCSQTLKNKSGEQYPIAHYDGGRFKNCFYNDELGDDSISKTTALPSSCFSSGELCYKINESLTEPVWHQNIDCGIKNEYPLPSPNYAEVYKVSSCSSDEIFYSNYNIVHHNFSSDICTGCGLPALVTESSGIVLNDSVDMKYYVRINNPNYYGKEISLYYSFNEATVNSYLPCSKESEGLYSAVVPCRTDKMNRLIYTKAAVSENSEIIYKEPESTEYSILKYADKILSDTENIYSDSCKKLILNLLSYGAEAQKYFTGDSTMKTIIDENYSDYFASFNVTLPTAENPDLSEFCVNLDVPDSSVYSISLTLNSKVNISINIKTTVPGYHINFTDMETGETKKIPLVPTNESGKYKAVIENISAENLLDNFTVTVADENENIKSHTVCYNVEKYIYSIENSGNSQINKADSISRALLGYAKAVNEYCANTNLNVKGNIK